MKQAFTLSKSNKIYFGVIAVLSFVFVIAFSDKTPYQMGELAGRLISFLLFPSLFAWISWRLSGKKEKGGSLTFNIVLTLILLGQIGQSEKKLQQSQALRDLQEQKEEFKKEVSSADSPADITASYKKFADSVEGGLDRLAETSTGAEKKFYGVMSNFTAELKATAQNWNASYTAVLSPRILDYSTLNRDEEFEYQYNVLEKYIEQTEVYNNSIANMVPDMKKRLSVLGEGDKLAKGAVKGATEKYLSQKPIFEPLMQAHIKYGKNMIRILELLQKNKGEWVYDNDELSFYSENLLNEYNELVEELGNNEATINTLSGRLLEKM